MIFENIKKLKKILENYDKIMMLIEDKPKKKPSKRYSSLNTPKNQLELIRKREEGEQ